MKSRETIKTFFAPMKKMFKECLLDIFYGPLITYGVHVGMKAKKNSCLPLKEEVWDFWSSQTKYLHCFESIIQEDKACCPLSEIVGQWWSSKTKITTSWQPIIRPFP